MAGKARHNCVSLDGPDPSTGGTKEYWIDKDYIQKLYTDGKLDKYKELHCVQELLLSPDIVIFEDLKREGQEKALCCAGLVSKAYDRSGMPKAPPVGKTFTVYVTEHAKIFRWGFDLSG